MAISDYRSRSWPDAVVDRTSEAAVRIVERSRESMLREPAQVGMALAPRSGVSRSRATHEAGCATTSGHNGGSIRACSNDDVALVVWHCDAAIRGPRARRLRPL